MKLETIYNLRAIPQIQAFAASTARLYGAGEKETTELELAVEEAAGHIISNYPPENNTAIFEITCNVDAEENVFRIIMRNQGLPVDAEHIPQYILNNPEESIDGLRFFLIERFTDNFYFRNCGNDGWLSVLEKKLESLTHLDTSHSEPEAQDGVPAAKSKTTISFATPEDAYEITKLAYHTYRYTYAKSIFYYPEILKEALESSTVISFAAKDESGSVVAQGAYIRSPRCREICEVGALMSSPEYRKSMVMIKLIKQMSRFPKVSNTDIQIFYSKLVTSHTGSQRITRLFDFVPIALRLSVYEHADFVAIEGTRAAPRESLLYSLWIPNPCDINPTLHTPPEHADISRQLVKRIPFTVDICDDTANPPEQETKLSIRRNPENGLATVRLELLGHDWVRTLRSSVRELCLEGNATIHLELAAHTPLPPAIEETLRQAGFFFAGFFPDTLEKWMLLYVYFNNQRFDFEAIQLQDDQALMLRDYIAECHRKAEEL